MKYFIVSDVHSFYDEMMKALGGAGYDRNNPDHVFVSLGDLFDRGNKAVECLEFVNSLPKENKILICGNHEDCMVDAIVKRKFSRHDYHNKTNETVEQFYKHYNPDKPVPVWKNDLLDWMSGFTEYKKYESDLQDYAIVGNNIFVHGWIPYWVRTTDQLKEADYSDWSDARWDNGMRQWHCGVKINGFTIYCGHFHTSWGNSRYHNDGVEFINPEYDYADFGITPYENFNPFVDDGIVAIDACTAYTGKVNCVVLEA